jgi:hypothetical protein
VAVNGAHKFQATNLDTLYDASGIVSVAITQPYYGTSAGINNGDFYLDNLYFYDFVGSSAVDTDFVPTTDGGGIATGYIGELQVRPLFANADTAETDFIRISGASDFSMINEADPNDATYIYSNAAGDLSEFDMDDLPEEITYVRGLLLMARASKPDAGVANITLGMKSNGDVFDTDPIPITVEPTYWYDFCNTDPDNGARWTRASLNAAKFRITRET